MAYRTLESVLRPDSHLTLSAAELPSHPVRVIVTILEDDEIESLTEIGDYQKTLLSARESARLRSPRLVHPEQAVDFVKEVIEVTDDARV